MNKFLVLALSVIALGFAAPAIADNHGDHSVVEAEATTEAAVEAEICHDENGEEVACVEEEADAEDHEHMDAEAEADMEAHDADDHDGEEHEE